jgi:hypothetical protein
MAKETRSSKMYKNSPHLERSAEGKMAVSKKGPDVAAGNSSDGVPKDKVAVMSLAHKHAEERLKLSQKHELEHHSLMSEHMSEGTPAHEAAETPKEEAKEKKEKPAEEAKEKEKGVE